MCKVSKQEVWIEMQEIKWLDLEVTAGATLNKTDGVYQAIYDPTGTTAIQIEATTNDGDVQWSTNPGGLAITPNGDKLTVALNSPGSVQPFGSTVEVTATTASKTASLKFRIIPLITGLSVVRTANDTAYYYAFEAAANTWQAVNTSGIPANTSVQLQVTTDPAGNEAASYVEWKAENTTDNSNCTLSAVRDPGSSTDSTTKKSFPLDTTGKIKTSVRLRTASDWSAAKSLEIDVLAPATDATTAKGLKVKLSKFTYAGAGYFGVTREDKTNFNSLYAADWTTANPTFPQAYSAGTAIAANDVTLSVETPPSEDVSVRVRATAYFLTKALGLVALTKDSGDVTVSASAVSGDLVDMKSLALGSVPNEVMHNNPLLIFWQASSDGGTSWVPLRVTANPVYVTAQAPVPSSKESLNRGASKTNPVYTYDSFLAISCTAAAGERGVLSTDNPTDTKTYSDIVRDKIVKAFDLSSGSVNPRMKLLYRGQVSPPSQYLTYWMSGKKPAQSVNLAPSTGNVPNLFFNDGPSVACGTWADMLIAMWALHGINNANRVEVTANTSLSGASSADGFLVRKIRYQTPPAVNKDAFTHAFSELVNAGRVAAQNNAASCISFSNHFIVWDATDKKLYDPSYGTPAIDMDDWVKGAVGGITNASQAGYVKALSGVSPIDIEANPQSIAFKDQTTGLKPA